MKPALAILCLLSLPSCAYWHQWRADAVETQAVDDVNRTFARY